MKTLIITLFVIFAAHVGIAQEHQSRIPLLGETAPAFEAESTQGKINYPGDYFNKWRLIVSHPGSFTPVCTSELIEMAAMQSQLRRMRAELIVISTDGVNSNLEWIKSMEEMQYKDKPTQKINFPIVSDLGFNISRMYGMQHIQSNSTKNIRGLFIIDPDNKIRLISFYPSEIGRHTDEIMRTLTALQEADRHSVLTPANWTQGEDYMLVPPMNKDEFEKMKRRKRDNEYFLTWYMWFRKS